MHTPPARLDGLSYSGWDSLAYRRAPVGLAQLKLNAQRKLALAAQIYREEWESMSPMVRPSAPNDSARRAWLDGFITPQEYDLLK